MMFGSTASEGEEQVVEAPKPHPRPLSWHPSSSKLLGSYEPPSTSEPHADQVSQEWGQYQSNSYQTGFDVQRDEASVYRSGLPFRNQGYPGNVSPVETADWHGQLPIIPYPIPSYTSLPLEPTAAYLQHMQSYPSTSPTSLGFLPGQLPHVPSADVEPDLEDDESNGTDKELVGMGLYDPPEGFSLLSSGMHEGTGKGLKLEETWQPPEQAQDDQDGDDVSEDEEEVEEPPTREDQKWSVHSGPQFPAELAGQSFFFEDDVTYTNELWFHPQKQPAAHTGLGYGWI